MIFLIIFYISIIGMLGFYAWRQIAKVRHQRAHFALRLEEARQSVRILINSFLNSQVDQAECVLRIRVLLDAHFAGWEKDLTSDSFLEVANQILSMPFGEARAQLDGVTRQSQDANRRQLLQLHEQKLISEFKQMKEWIDR